MTTTTSTPPPDPEFSALALLIEAAETATGSTAFRRPLQDLTGLLHDEGALASLAWTDARLVAGAVSFDACNTADPVGSLRSRAAAVRAGVRPPDLIVDPAGVAWALDMAATILDTM